jgi:sortase A
MILVAFLLMACTAPPAEEVKAGIAPEELAISGPIGLPDRIVVPAIHLDTPVVELGWSSRSGKAGQVFSEWDVADFAAGWHKNSARPGYGSNVVLSGHNNIKGAVFRELDQLRRGDVALLYVGDETYEYTVDDVLIVPEKYATPEQRRQNAAWIAPTNEERLTLVSCWPRDDNSHRIIVIASPVKNGAAAGP